MWFIYFRMNRVLIVIGGPTASGKTDLAIKVAKYFNTEIISADSRQCYREISIGTAKPDEKQLNEVPHHFINSHSINEIFNSGKFAIEGEKILQKIFNNSPYAIVAGGSGLYIKALIKGLDEFPEISYETRKKLQEEYQSKGLEYIQSELRDSDIEYYQNVDINNPRRIIRALEVFRESGKPYSSFLKKNTVEKNYQVLNFTTNPDRDQLYRNIDNRVTDMIGAGLVDEALAITEYRNHPALQTVGYREIFDYQDGKYDLETAIDKIRQHTRNYAKRQVTWFRNQGDFVNLDPESPFSDILKRVKQAVSGTF